MRTKLKQMFYAWAIDTNYTDIDGKKYPGFVGRYWWGSIPSHLEGCKISVFKTRKEANIKLPNVKVTFPAAKVVRVKLTVEEI